MGPCNIKGDSAQGPVRARGSPTEVAGEHMSAGKTGQIRRRGLL